MALPLLHDYWRSSASYRVRIALALKGLDYATRPVDLLAQQQRSAGHLALNPQGLVPVLEIDGLVLIQSLAILEYLEETRPAPPLLPALPAERARVRALAEAVACEIHPVCNLAVVDQVLALAGGGQQMKQGWMADNIARGLAAVEALLESPMTGRFCHGDRPGLADCCLIPQLYNARRWGVALETWPRLGALEAAAADHPAFVAAHPDRHKPPAAA